MDKKKKICIKLCLVVLLLFLPLTAFGQRIGICYCYKGSWSSWEHINVGRLQGKVDYSGIYLRTSGGILYFSFWFDATEGGDICDPLWMSPTEVPKSVRRQHLKTDTWYEYDGYVEYYVSDEYPTAADLAKACVLVAPNPRTDTTPKVKRQAKATIKIAPYKKHPEVYNVWFDGIGVAISIYGLGF